MNTGDFRLLYYFIEIVNAGSIRGAARKLGLSPAVVSTALSDLETAVSATLITRTTRQMKLTDIGSAVFAKAGDAVAAVREAMETPAQEPASLTGKVSVTVPTELATTWLPPLLTRFRQLYPDVQTAVNADDAAVDLILGNHDIALRTEFQAIPRPGADVVAIYPLDLVCSHQLASGLSGDLEADLRRIAFIGSDHQTRNGMLYARHVQTDRDTLLAVNLGFTIDNRQVALELARQGFGAALLMSISTARDISAGTLEKLGENYRFGHVVVRVVMRDRLPSPAAARMRELFLAEGQVS